MPITVPTFGGDARLLARLSEAARAARERGVTVIYVRVCFRPGYPDLSPVNKIFKEVVTAMDLTEANPSTDVHPAVAPEANDIVVTKRRVSAFSGSDLELVLRSSGIRTLALAGVATSGSVLSTLRQAADLDLSLVVLSDGCADRDEEVHRILIEKIFPTQADVMTIQQWTSSL